MTTGSWQLTPLTTIFYAKGVNISLLRSSVLDAAAKAASGGTSSPRCSGRIPNVALSPTDSFPGFTGMVTLASPGSLTVMPKSLPQPDRASHKSWWLAGCHDSLQVRSASARARRHPGLKAAHQTKTLWDCEPRHGRSLS